MLVVVDRDRCEGNAVSVRNAPEVFTLDNDEYAIVSADPVPVAQGTVAEQAVAEWPRAALSRKDEAAEDDDVMTRKTGWLLRRYSVSTPDRIRRPDR